jgi:hypothetical protein
MILGIGIGLVVVVVVVLGTLDWRLVGTDECSTSNRNVIGPANSSLSSLSSLAVPLAMGGG